MAKPIRVSYGGNVWTLALICLVGITCGSAVWAEDDLAQLRDVQARIRRVAAQNTLATVLVSDGIGSGSGVIVSPDGLVLTAGHVLTTGGNRYRVTLPTGQEVRARPLGKNLDIDAGMVQIDEPGPWPFVELGNSEELDVSDWVVCLGHPGGYEIGRTPPVRAGKILEFRPGQVITDCALIGGDSGGPLFDLDGRLIAIHSSISDSIAINRHVSIRSFKDCWERLQRGESWGVLPDLAELEDEEYPRAGLGISLDLARAGGWITKVRPGAAAAKSGIQVGDNIVQIDDVQIDSPRQVIDFIGLKSPGDEVDVIIERGAQRLQFRVKLDAI